MPILSAQRKKQRNFITVVVMVLGTTVGILYFGILRTRDSGSEVFKSEINIFRSVREIHLDLDLLKEDRFLDLVPYGKLPTDIETGRKNPFSPYSANNNDTSSN